MIASFKCENEFKPMTPSNARLEREQWLGGIVSISAERLSFACNFALLLLPLLRRSSIRATRTNGSAADERDMKEERDCSILLWA
jgi:hypothetical protein